MRSYPLHCDLSDRLCLVVGGGSVGARKVQGLASAGARVRLVEPRDDAPACSIAGVEHVRRHFAPVDLDGAVLVFAASDDPEVNAEVARLARERGQLCSRADLPGGGDFSVPATLNRGELAISVSSHGGHPGFAASLRDRLAGQFDESWGYIAAMARVLRRRRLTSEETDTYNRAVMRFLWAEELPSLVTRGDGEGIERLLQKFLGRELSLAELGLPLPTDEP